MLRDDLRRGPVPLLVAVALGVLLGLAARAGDHAPVGTVGAATALGGPWLVVAFAAGAVGARVGAGGRVARRREARAGAVRGAVCVIAGVVVYYAMMWLVERRTGPGYAVPVATAWSLGGVVVGGSFGALGAAWRTGGPWASRWAAVLGGALLGEAVVLRALWERPDLERVAALQALAALVLVAALAPRPRAWPAALPVLASTAGAFALAALVLREGARAAGWAGA
ncbi:DUF6518 family protein [Paraconexibacter algicola]|uniref:Uncharacterized protein n=1 Tax=Paraconexibacter algicola TaxID=2133960 RepID=A0A2T4UIQ3_9ACTN|nr:DUF6518 family protein [Paraconexibacter algicola]PTL59121.1 hypothetical protein C7Y72_05390 [Paraconexibacter algicola]